MENARKILSSIQGKHLDRLERGKLSIQLAKLLFEEANRKKTREERRDEKWQRKLLEDPKGKAFTALSTDLFFRTKDKKRAVIAFHDLLQVTGIPNFIIEKGYIKILLFNWLGKIFSHLFYPFIRKEIMNSTKKVFLPFSKRKRERFLKKEKENGILTNYNHLGEAILGEEEAKKRLSLYLNALEHPDIPCISIKASTLYSQINLIDFNKTKAHLLEPLSILYERAASCVFIDREGKSFPKQVYLDMENFSDLDLTFSLFQEIALDPRFYKLSPGIALQSYIPDSYLVQKRLISLALERKKRGGAPLYLRIVKGANLMQERVESAKNCFPLPCYLSKEETDANFKRMLEEGFIPDHAKALHIGVASHNLFEIAYALILREERGLDKEVRFEMLKGMAEAISRSILEITSEILLYSPATSEEEFPYAISYLMRRLDENSGEHHFLKEMFSMEPGNEAWNKNASFFLEGCKKMERLSQERRRKRNPFLYQRRSHPEKPFQNEPDIDLSTHFGRSFARFTYQIKEFEEIPLIACGKELKGIPEHGFDPSRPGVASYTYNKLPLSLVQECCGKAKEAALHWKKVEFSKRSEILSRASEGLRRERGSLIQAMIGDSAKIFSEADVEVSEAIDFIEYYRKIWDIQQKTLSLEFEPKGVVLVAPPWNFPLSIPTSGVVSSLLAGNAVLFKPAPETVLTAYLLAKILWDAGVPKDVLSFVPCDDDPVASALVKDPNVNTMILTGGTETAKKIMKIRPSLDLIAETGGKNVIIATSFADRDQLISGLLVSAFGHAGQKCSACSLAILDNEIYDDIEFLKSLKDACASLKVGSAWDPSTYVPPLIRKPEGNLLKALTTLEEGESWLVEPKISSENPNLVTPSIKLGVRALSFTHQNEFFGPLLGIMRAENLNEAIEMANQTPFGLTSGLYTLNENEKELWEKEIIAGNLYINRPIVSARVQRQPFGGTKDSSYGPGTKVGGPSFMFSLSKAKSKPTQSTLPFPSHLQFLIEMGKDFLLSPNELKILEFSLSSYAAAAKKLFMKKDPTSLLGEDNFFYHIPYPSLCIRIRKGDSPLDFLRIIGASLLSESKAEISTEIPLNIPSTMEDEPTFFERIPSFRRIRFISSPDFKIRVKASESMTYLIDREPLIEGEVEMLHYLREVALSHLYHRFGYLGFREGERRKGPPCI